MSMKCIFSSVVTSPLNWLLMFNNKEDKNKHTLKLRICMPCFVPSFQPSRRVLTSCGMFNRGEQSRADSAENTQLLFPGPTSQATQSHFSLLTPYRPHFPGHLTFSASPSPHQRSLSKPPLASDRQMFSPLVWGVH